MSELHFWLQRIAKTGLRAFHILGVCGIGGGVLLQVPFENWKFYWVLAMATGCTLLLWEVIRDWRWLIQLKGVFTLLKVALLLLFIPFPEYKAAIFTVILLLSVLITHGPANFRHYSIYHRQCIKSKKEIKG